jgi:hypothetical protein
VDRIADLHALNEVGFRKRSSSRCTSLVVMRSVCVVGCGIGKVKGKYEASSSIFRFWATEGMVGIQEARISRIFRRNARTAGDKSRTLLLMVHCRGDGGGERGGGGCIRSEAGIEANLECCSRL